MRNLSQTPSKHYPELLLGSSGFWKFLSGISFANVIHIKILTKLIAKKPSLSHNFHIGDLAFIAESWYVSRNCEDKDPGINHFQQGFLSTQVFILIKRTWNAPGLVVRMTLEIYLGKTKRSLCALSVQISPFPVHLEPFLRNIMLREKFN